MKHTSTVPRICGFIDFCQYHQNKKPIYMVRGKLYADFDMLVNIKYKYDFADEQVKKEIEKAIEDNLYMFDVQETNKFYYPNDNMTSNDNSISNIKGQVLYLKELNNAGDWNEEEIWEAISELSDIRAQYNLFDDRERPKYHACSEGIRALRNVICMIKGVDEV